MIKTVFELGEIYSEKVVESQLSRYKEVVKKFKAAYGHLPNFLARAPGRVNIIGEHIDYCGFGVLPMGIERDIVTAVSVGSEVSAGEVVLKLTNSQPDKYASRQAVYSEKEILVIDKEHDWSNYAKAGFKGVISALNIKPKLMLCLVDGTVPGGGGLSSSSALVCSLSMATAYAQEKVLDASTIATIAADAERLVGVNGGGMDQACSMLAKRGTALSVSFSPIRASPVPFPQSSLPMSFVVANSLVVSNKAVTAPRNYNLRVVETRLSAALLSKQLQIVSKVGDYPTLSDVVQNIPENMLSSAQDNFERDIFSLEVLLKVTKTALKHHEKGYSIDEICLALGLSEFEVKNRFLSKFPVEASTFHLFKRTHHVLTEAQRVLMFKYVCQTSPKNVYQQLAKLMNSSHSSCRDMFDCSCAELENLITLCNHHGALAARLTGAGWGGCVVCLVPSSILDVFLEGLKKDFYPNLSNEEFDSACFATQPAQGAAYLTNLDFLIT